jgi:hypothetical protein
MAFDHVKLADPQSLGSSVASVYANPSGKRTYITGVTIHNTNTTVESVELYVVPDNATAVGTATDVPHRVFKSNVAASDTVFFEAPAPGWVLSDQNDSLQGKSTTASKVNITLHGDTYTP